MPADAIEITLTCDDPQIDVSHMIVHRLRARERLSEPYDIELDVACLDAVPDLDTIEGARLRVELSRNGTTLRTFAGIIAAARDRYEHGSGHHWYHLRLAPQFHVAKLVEKFDVRLNEEISDMLDAKLGDLGMIKGTDYALSGEIDVAPPVYAAREMMVQFRETDFDFISRWCEHYGIYYFFYIGPAGDEVQVFADDVASYRSIDSSDEAVAWVGTGEQTGIYAWQAERVLVPVLYVCRDYNEDKPADELHADHEYPDGFGGGIYDYGGHFKTTAEAGRLAAVRAGEQVAQRTVYHGESDDPRFAPGHTFELCDHPAHNGRRVLVEVLHEASQHVAGWGGANEIPYRNSFQAIDALLVYRPPRKTKIPRVHGLISAIIHTGQGQIERDAMIDSEGRYKVRFMFDYEVQARSCPVRMIQPHAGTNYGIHFPLKPGIEVAIAFLDGNPDRPLIVGAVPNKITQTPVASDHGSKNRIKTRSGILIELDDTTRGT